MSRLPAQDSCHKRTFLSCHCSFKGEEEAGSEEGFDNRDTQDGQGPNEHVLWPAICNASTRGDLVDPSSFPDQDLRLNIGICGIEKEDESFLEVR